MFRQRNQDKLACNLHIFKITEHLKVFFASDLNVPERVEICRKL